MQKTRSGFFMVLTAGVLVLFLIMKFGHQLTVHKTPGLESAEQAANHTAVFSPLALREGLSSFKIPAAAGMVRVDAYNPGLSQVPSVVLIHNLPNKTQPKGQLQHDLASSLAQDGFLSINVHYYDLPREKWPDVFAAAVTFAQSVRNADPGRIGMLGYGTGATLALVAAARDLRIKALVLNSAAIPWDFKEKDTRALPPTLVIAAKGDKSLVTLSKLRKWLSAHGQTLEYHVSLQSPDELDEKRVVQDWNAIRPFLRKYLKPSTQAVRPSRGAGDAAPWETF